MVLDRRVHVVALSSIERADQARACYGLDYHAEIYSIYDELIAARPLRGIVLAEDIPERGGIAALIAGMAAHGLWLPVLATGIAADPARVVAAVRGGAIDYLTLPLDRDRLLAGLDAGQAEGLAVGSVRRRSVDARSRLAALTTRENEVLDLLVAGSSNKAIAHELKISPRTVEIHRANMMAKLGAHHAADAIRLRLEAALMGSGGQGQPGSAQVMRG